MLEPKCYIIKLDDSIYRVSLIRSSSSKAGSEQLRWGCKAALTAD